MDAKQTAKQINQTINTAIKMEPPIPLYWKKRNKMMKLIQ
jgi:hypothetical protein